MRSLVLVLIQSDWCPYKERLGDRQAWREDHVMMWEKAPVCKPRREASGETNPTDNLISDFSLQDCEKINFCCLSHPVCRALLWQPEQTNTVVNKNLLNKGTPSCQPSMDKRPLDGPSLPRGRLPINDFHGLAPPAFPSFSL